MLSRLLIPFCCWRPRSSPPGPIRFEDATRKAESRSRTASARRNWVRSSKAPARARSGSITTTTATRICTWFRDAFRAGMHPYPLRKAPDPAASQPPLSNNRDGTFTDVTSPRGRLDLFSMAAIAADYDNDGNEDCWSPATAASFYTAIGAMARSKM